MLKPSFPLAVIAGTCAMLLVLTQTLTGERIEANVREHELRLVTELTGTTPPASSTWSNGMWDMGNGTVLVRADVSGYGGPISMVIAVATTVRPQRTIGVRVTSHQETPGLADFIGQPERGWLAELSGLSRGELGSVDVVSGATITSNAVRRGVAQALSRAGDGVVGPAASTP